MDTGLIGQLLFVNKELGFRGKGNSEKVQFGG